MAPVTEPDVRRMVEEFNERDVSKVVEQYATDAVFQVPVLDAPLRGKDAIRSYLTGLFTAFPDWSMDLKKVIIQGNEVVLVNTVQGTHTGPYTGSDGQPVVPTNEKVAQQQLTRVVINEQGKISLFHSFGNPGKMKRLLRSPKAPPQ